MEAEEVVDSLVVGVNLEAGIEELMNLSVDADVVKAVDTELLLSHDLCVHDNLLQRLESVIGSGDFELVGLRGQVVVRRAVAVLIVSTSDGQGVNFVEEGGVSCWVDFDLDVASLMQLAVRGLEKVEFSDAGVQSEVLLIDLGIVVAFPWWQIRVSGGVESFIVLEDVSGAWLVQRDATGDGDSGQLLVSVLVSGIIEDVSAIKGSVLLVEVL